VDHKAAIAREILKQLPGGDVGIVHLCPPDSLQINEQIMRTCCHREKLVASFCEAFREPYSVVVDQRGWQKLAQMIPAADARKDVYVAADLCGYFRAPASRVRELIDARIWTHEVYLVGVGMDWLVGVKHDRLFSQGRAAPEGMALR
jgi:hypothetical protein